MSKMLKVPNLYLPSGVGESIQQQSDYYQSLIDRDIQESTLGSRNYLLGKGFEEAELPNPFIQTGENESVFDTNAKFIKEQYDDPKKELFRQIYNDLVIGQGKIKKPGFIEKAFKSSMTASWAKMFGAEGLDLYKGLKFTEDGISYKGDNIKLSPEQYKIVTDYADRISGTDRGSSFFDDFIATTTSLTMDMPLMVLTGGISGEVAGASKIISALSQSTGIIPRMLGNVAHNLINFNLLEAPTTVEGFQEGGLRGGLDSIFHATGMGLMASATGGAGRALAMKAPFIKSTMENTPILREEIGSLLGSFGFGYASTKVMGGTTRDGLVAGLSFAATHFTNPTAYKKVIEEQIRKPLEVFIDREKGIISQDYFVRKDDGKLYQINKELFKKDGRIEPLDGVEGLKITPEIDKQLIHYNQVPDETTVKFWDLIEKQNLDELVKPILADLSKGMDSEKYKQNLPQLEMIAKSVVLQTQGDKLRKLIGKQRLPEDAELQNKMIQLSESKDAFSLSYSTLKRIVRDNIDGFIKDKEASKQKIMNTSLSEKAKPEIISLLETAEKAFINEGKRNEKTIWNDVNVDQLVDYHKAKLAESLQENDLGGIAYHNERILELSQRYNANLKQKESDAKKNEPKKKYSGEEVIINEPKEPNRKLQIEIENIKKGLTEDAILQANKRALGALEQPEKTTGEELYGKEGSIRKEIKSNVKEEPKVEEIKAVPEKNEVIENKSEEKSQNIEISSLDKPGEKIEKKEYNNITSIEKTQPGLNKKEFIPEIIKSEDANSEKNRLRQTLADELNKVYDTLETEGIDPEFYIINRLKDKGYGRVDIAKTLQELNIPIYKDKTEQQIKDRVANISRGGTKKLNEQKERYDSYKSKADDEIRKETIREKEPELEIKEEDVVEKQQKPLEEMTDREIYELERQNRDKSIEDEERFKADVYEKGSEEREMIGSSTIRMKSGEHGLTKNVEDATYERLKTELGIDTNPIDINTPEGQKELNKRIARFFNKRKGRGFDLTDKELKAYDRIMDELMGFNESTTTKNMDDSGLWSRKDLPDEFKRQYDKGRRQLTENDIKYEIDKLNARFEEERTGWKARYEEDLNGKGLTDFQNKVIKLGKSATIDTPAHETLHYATSALGKEAVWSKFLRQAGWDGNGGIMDYVNNPTLRAAHERLAEEYADYRLGYTPDRDGMFSRLTDFFKRVSNYLRGNGWYQKADYFKMLADGKLKARNTIMYDRFMGSMDQLKSSWDMVVRSKPKSFDILMDNLSYKIDDSFWKMLKNKGIKDAEINYLRLLIPEGPTLSGDKVKNYILDALYPLRIERSEESRVEGAKVKNIVFHGTFPTEYYKNLSINGNNYGEFRMVLPFPVRQTHEYNHLNENTIHWFRGNEDSSNRRIYRVNELQSQVQYMKNDLDAVTNKNLIDRYSVGGEDKKQPEYIASLAPHWERHAINALIQWAHDKGYTKLRFPKDRTVDSIEGYYINENIRQEVAQLGDDLSKVDRHLSEGENDKAADLMIEQMKKNETGDIGSVFIYESKNDEEGRTLQKFISYDKDTGTWSDVDSIETYTRWNADTKLVEKTETITEQRVKHLLSNSKMGLEELRSELQEKYNHFVGINKYIEPVRRFYDENIAQYLKKTRKDNFREVVDKDGYQWYETDIRPNDIEDIYLWSKLDTQQSGSAKKEHEELKILNYVNREQDYVKHTIPEKIRYSTGVDRYYDMGVKLFRESMTPPAWYTVFSPRFAEIHRPLEEMLVRGVPKEYNSIMKDTEGWNNGKPFRSLSTQDRDGLMEINRKYERDVYDGVAPKDMKTDEVISMYGMNDAQANVVRLYAKAVRASTNIARQGLYDRILKHNDRIAETLMDADDIRLFFADEFWARQIRNENGVVDYKKVDEIINADPQTKEDIAKYLSEKMHPDYGDKYYFNSVRPINKNTWIIEATRPSTNPNHEQIKDEQGNVIGNFERVSTYANDVYAESGTYKFYSNAIKDRIVEGLQKDGWTITKEYNIGKEIGKGNYWERLTHQELINLANAGHIDLTDEVIQKMFNAIKTGTYEQHHLNKSYIPGLYHTAEEYENGLSRLVRNAINSNYRQNSILESRKKLQKWNEELNQQDPRKQLSEKDYAESKRDYDYAVKYYNNITHSDDNVIDSYRNVISTFYTALKVSFLSQQALQGLQTTLHLAVAEAQKNGFGAFYKGTKDAFGIGLKNIGSKRQRLPRDFNPMNVSDEKLKLMQDLDDAGLLGRTFREELFGVNEDISTHYLKGAMKYASKSKYLMNMMSANIERFTRLQSFSTFYDIGVEKGLKGNDLFNYVGDKIHQSMSQWGVAGRPPIAASKFIGKGTHPGIKALEKSFYTFKTFATHNLGMYEYLMRNRQWGALASKMLVGTGIHGITKFPFIATLFAVANLFTEDDTEYEFLNMLDELDNSVGGKFGRTLAKGLPSMMGIDATSLMDEKSAFATDLLYDTKSRSVEGKLAEAMIGAPYGYSKDLVDVGEGVLTFFNKRISQEHINEEEARRIKKQVSKFMPLFIRNIMAGANLHKDGYQISGKTIIKRDDLTWADVFYKSMGFQPLELADKLDEQFYGVPHKLARTKGKITELKKIRSEISKSNEYSPEEKHQELLKAKDMLTKLLKEQALLEKLNQKGVKK